MNLIEKYIGEKVPFPSGRTAYTPDDIIKVIKANKKYQGKTGKVIQNMISKKDQKIYHIEVEVDGKRIVLKNTEVEMVKPRKL
jgi:ribosomal protein L21E